MPLPYFLASLPAFFFSAGNALIFLPCILLIDVFGRRLAVVDGLLPVLAFEVGG